ncbi:MAG: sugar ABC transporter substrate-binding protein [Chloroflexota bacterium]|nr:sugar ABC transporter substrate-binding protein [Chloroflexota bacterium]MDQ6906264.1 sugar ABC transporter substrate-binding protein [Chloroflexota bacterium]
MNETPKRLSRRDFLAAATAATGAAILAACGGSSATETPKAAATVAGVAATTAPLATAGGAAATTAPAPAASAAGGASATTTTNTAAGGKAPTGAINYWHHFTSDTEMKGLERITTTFKTQYPGVTVTQENIPNASYMQKFTAAVQAKSLPDTVMVSAERVNDMVAMNGLKDLTERINNSTLKKDLPDNRWTAATVNGKTYGVPAFMFVNWMYYRADWFKEAGITAPPKTWAEFQDIAVKLTDPAKNRFGFGLRGGDGGEGWVEMMLRAFGSPIVDDKGKPAMDVAKATEGLKYYTELFTKYKVAPPSAPNDSYAQVMTAFKTGQTGMVLHHTGSLKEVRDALGDKFMTAPYPAGPAAHIADVTPLYNGLSQTIKDDRGDAGWAWITQWTTPDAEIALLEETGYFPASIAAANDSRVTGNPLYKAATDTLTFGTLPPQFNGGSGWLKQSVLPTFQKVLLGQATPAQGVDQMNADLKKATS